MRLMGLGLGSLLLITVWTLIPPTRSIQGEIAQELGCRPQGTMIILEILRDGSVRWPNGDVCTIQMSALRIASLRPEMADAILAIRANDDTLMLLLKPLLDAAQNRGLQRVVFTSTDQGPVRIIQR